MYVCMYVCMYKDGHLYETDSRTVAQAGCAAAPVTVVFCWREAVGDVHRAGGLRVVALHAHAIVLGGAWLQIEACMCAYICIIVHVYVIWICMYVCDVVC